MKTLNAREKTFAKITILIAGLVLLDWSAKAIPWRVTSRIDRQIIRQQEQLVQDRLAIRNKNKILREFRGSMQSTGKAGLQGMNGLVNEIEMLARASGVKIKDISPQVVAGSNTKWAAAVVFESSWANLARFSYDVHKSVNVLQIEKANLRRKTDTDPAIQGRLLISQMNEV